MCESFDATLECELLDKHRFCTHKEVELAIFDFIEGSYNLYRRGILHSTTESSRESLLCDARQ